MGATATAAKATTEREQKIAKKKCWTPEFRVSFPFIFKMRPAFKNATNQEAKYELTMLFPKSVDLRPLKVAALNAGIEKWGPKETWPRGIKMPFKDGDLKQDLTGYAGCIYVKATSKQPVGIVDQQLLLITPDDGKFYAGCYARATLIAYTYDVNGNKGISFALNNVQKLKDGEPFSGRKKAEDEFDAVDSVDDDTGASVDTAEDDDGLGLD